MLGQVNKLTIDSTGDKETFWIGWELAGDTDYSFHQGDAGIMGVLEPADGPDDNIDEHNHEHEHEHHQDQDHGHNGQDHQEEKRRKKHPKPHEDDVTICGPQILHFDTEGRPLWFNGWLYRNKFAGGKKTGGRFDHFIKEPREISDPTAWQLEEHNVCCLSNRQAFQFTEEERDKLEMLIDFGRKAGCYVDDTP